MKLSLKRTENQILILWNAVSKAESYDLKIVSSDLAEIYTEINVTDTNYTISLSEENTSFNVIISAVDKDGNIIDNINESVNFNSLDKIDYFENDSNADDVILEKDNIIPKATVYATTPAAPTNLKSVSALDSITFTWSAVSGANGYEVTFNGATKIITGTSIKYSGLESGKLYSFKIRSKNSSGQYSSYSSRSTYTLANPPSNIRITSLSASSVTVRWDNVSGATGYDVEFNGTVYKASTSGSGNYKYWYVTVSNLTPHTSYSYRVRTNNSGGNGPYSASSTVRTLLPTPTVTKTSTTNSVSLSYGVTGATNYDITFNNTDYNVTTTSKTFTGLEANKSFSYGIVAKNSYNNSAKASGTVTTLPTKLSNVTAKATANSVTISWSKITNASGYEIVFNGKTYNVSSGTTSYTLSKLTPNTNYSYSIRAKNASGYGEATSGTIRTLLETPLNLKITSVTENSVTIQWGAVTGATSYNITFNGVDYNVTATSKTFTGLEPDTKYTCVVKAKNSYTVSAETRITATTLPPIPENISDKPAVTSIAVSWDRLENATGYELVFNGKTYNVTTSTTGRRSQTVSGLTANTKYTYKLRAKNSGGYGKFSPDYTTATLLATPLNLRVLFVTENTATIQWDAVTGATNYVVTFNNVTYTVSGTSKTFTGLSADTKYTCNVKAKNSYTQSGTSNTLTVLTLPPVPENISDSAKTTSVTISWNRLENATGYELVFNGTTYNISASTASRRSYSISNLVANTKYTYKLRAKNSSGYGKFSSEHVVTTLPEAPIVPTNVNASSTYNTVTITWDSVPGAASYDVYLSGTVVNTSRTSYTFTGLNANTSYYYKVRAVNAGGYSSYSTQKTIKTLVAPPSVPINVKASGITQNQMTISCSSVPGATSYDFNFNSTVYNTTSTSKTFTNLKADTEYTFSVKANNSGGSSSYSAVKSAWTKRIPKYGKGPSYRNRYYNGKTRQTSGDPVDVINGAFYWNYTLLRSYAKDSMEFTVNYNSLSDIDSVLGSKWSYSYNYLLELYNDHAYFTLPDGEAIYFLYDESTGKYTSESGQTEYTLEKTNNIYYVKHVDGRKYKFDSSGCLAEISQNNIVSETFTKNSSGQIIKITGRYGSAFNIQYSGNEISNVSDSAGNKVSFEYQQDNLVKITNSENNKLLFSYDTSGNITKISDFSGNVYIVNSYTDGHIMEQKNNVDNKTTFEYDKANKINIFTDEDGNKIKYTFDTNENVTKIEHGLGIISKKYNSKKQLTQQIDEMNRITNMSYDNNMRLTQITYPGGLSEKIAYNDFNKPIKLTNTDETEVKFTYDDNGNLLSETDELGKSEYYNYDSNDNLTSYTDRNGNVSNYTYDTTGQLKTYTDPLGNTYKYIYDSIGQLLRTESPLGNVVTYKYSPSGNIVSITENGITETYSYDKNGNCISMYDKMGNSCAFTYDAMGNLTSETDFMGNKYLFAYNSRGYVKEATDPLSYKETFDYDAVGNLIRQVDKNGNVTTHVYNSASDLIEVKIPNNSSIKFQYDTKGQISSAIDPNNNTTKFTYNKRGMIETITDALGNSIKFTYDGLGNILTETDQKGSVIKYTYDNESNLLSAESDQGIINYVYDKAGRLTEVRDENNNSEKSNYDADGNVISRSDKEGNIIQYIYNEAGLLSEKIDSLGGSIKCEYDNNGNLIKITDADDNIYLYSYNANNLLIKATDPLGYVTSISYNERCEITSITDANGGETFFEYDGNGNVIKEINAVGGVTTYTYDELNNVSSIEDENGHIQQFKYDKAGNQIEWIDANNNKLTIAYDAVHRPVSVTDGNGNIVTANYDKKGNVTKIVDQDKAATSYEYDSKDRIVKVSDALGNSTELSYDAVGNLISCKDAKGNISTYSYTPNGNIKMFTDPEGNTESYSYNAMGWITEKTDSLGNTTSYKYNAVGQVTSFIDEAKGETKFTYNYKDQITSVTDPKGNVTYYKYDGCSNLIQTTDAKGEVYHYEYDALNNIIKMYSSSNTAPTLFQYDKKGRKIKEILPTKAERTYQYDGNGNVISFTDEENNITTYEYNLFDQKSSISYSDGKKATFRYSKAGHLIEFKDWNGTTSFSRDLLGRITKVTDHNGKVTSYTYDSVGNKLSMLYPDGNMINYTYNKNNMLIGVADGNNNTAAFEYDKNGNTTKVTQSNGNITKYIYNALGYVTNISFMSKEELRLSQNFSYDKAGNITSCVQTSDNPLLSKTKTYGYDKINQLILYSENGNTTEYVYDGSGNRIKEILDDETEIKYEYNALNQLLSKSIGNTKYSYSYDNRGNLISEKLNDTVIKSYVFDTAGNLTEGHNIETGENSVYSYNAFDVRVGLKQQLKNSSNILTAKELSYVTDYTSEDFNDIMISEKGQKVSSIVYGRGNERLSQIVKSASNSEILSKTFLQSDILGSPIIVSDSNSNLVNSIQFDPWGNLTVPYSDSINICFTNHSYDPIIDKYYAQKRFYDARTGRMMSLDPDYSDANLYRYSLNNPVAYVDSSGEIPVWVIPAIVDFFTGGAREVFNQMVLQGKDFDEVSWGRVAFAGVRNAAVGYLFGKIGNIKNILKFLYRSIEEIISNLLGAIAEDGDLSFQDILVASIRGVASGFLNTIKYFLEDKFNIKLGDTSINLIEYSLDIWQHIIDQLTQPTKPTRPTRPTPPPVTPTPPPTIPTAPVTPPPISTNNKKEKPNRQPSSPAKPPTRSGRNPSRIGCMCNCRRCKHNRGGHCSHPHSSRHSGSRRRGSRYRNFSESSQRGFYPRSLNRRGFNHKNSNWNGFDYGNSGFRGSNPKHYGSRDFFDKKSNSTYYNPKSPIHKWHNSGGHNSGGSNSSRLGPRYYNYTGPNSHKFNTNDSNFRRSNFNRFDSIHHKSRKLGSRRSKCRGRRMCTCSCSFCKKKSLRKDPRRNCN